MSDYESLFNGEYVSLNYDAEDQSLPFQIEVEDGTWFTSEDAEGIIEALSEKLGRKAPNFKVDDTEALNVTLIRVAAAYEQAISFRYAKGKTGRTIENRTLVPQEVKTYNDHLTVVGYDPDRDDIRAYRIDRIKGTVSLA